MLGIDIKQKINENNIKLEELVTPGSFVLNKDIKEILEENKKLRNDCPHEYDSENICIYCGSIKED